MPEDRPRLLAVVSRFKWVHINYLKALEAHFEVRVAWSGEGGRGAPGDGQREGLRGAPIGWIRDDGADAVRAALEGEIAGFRPDLIHLMYYNHDELTLMARELAGEGVPLIYECRDPQTTLSGAEPGSEVWDREGRALRASDAQILVSEALRDYFEHAHDLDLAESSEILPFGFARATIAPPSPKLSADDGRVHIVLVGTADDAPGHGRWYVDIIRWLVSIGLVVHSHFFGPPRFEMGLDLSPYHELARELEDYNFHNAVPHRQGTVLSELVSRYDLMGVFHELEAAQHNESATLAVCLPTKAVCGWCLGGIPTVCFPHYRGIVERVERLGIGFVISDWEDLAGIAADRAGIAAATRRCLETRDQFTNEHNADRVRDLAEPLLAGEFPGQSSEPGPSRAASAAPPSSAPRRGRR